jgi:CHASE3 domain sensor protein
MKKLSVLFSFALIFALVSCGGLKTDVKKMLKLYKEYTAEANKASEDEKLDESEIKTLNEIQKKMDEFDEEMEKKYEDNDEADDEAEKLMKELDGETVMKEFMEAIDKLYECEGWEDLE